MKLLALDIGEKKVGVAKSDENQIVVSPLPYIEIGHRLLGDLGKIIKEEEINKVVLGLPRHQSGDVAVFAEQIKEFAKVIEHEYNVLVEFEDESGTTIEATRRLKEAGKTESEIKELVDSESACVILESYLKRSLNT